MLFTLLVSFAQVGVSQTYKYLSMEDGLSSQKVLPHPERFFGIYVVSYTRGC